MFNQISFKTISSSSVFLLSILIHLDTMTMRPTTKGASNFTSKVLPMSLTGSTKTFSNRPWPTSESIASAQALGQSKHNQSEQQSQAGSGNQTKWYQGKPFKGAARRVGAAGVNAGGAIAVGSAIIYATTYANTDDVADVDPELNDVILKIKKDLGVPESVPVRIAKKSYNMRGAGAHYLSKFDVVVLAANYRTWSKSFLISAIVHEFEHYRQWHKYHESHHSYWWKADKLRVETGADAAAAGYFDCPECLKTVAWGAKNLKYDPRETDVGYITTEKGYFSPQDYDDYIKRAQCEGTLCAGHVEEDAEFEILKKILSGEMLTSEERDRPSYTYPLKDYLPGPK